MTETELHEILQLAVRMRDKQKRYFKTRSQQALIESKQLERQFDEALAKAGVTV